VVSLVNTLALSLPVAMWHVACLVSAHSRLYQQQAEHPQKHQYKTGWSLLAIPDRTDTRTECFFHYHLTDGHSPLATTLA